MTLQQFIPLTINASIFFLVLALGLKTEKGDAVYLLGRPGLLGRSILSMNVVMLVFAVAVALVLPLDPAVKIALVALAVSPVPPILPAKQTRREARHPMLSAFSSQPPPRRSLSSPSLLDCSAPFSTSNSACRPAAWRRPSWFP